MLEMWNIFLSNTWQTIKVLKLQSGLELVETSENTLLKLILSIRSYYAKLRKNSALKLHNLLSHIWQLVNQSNFHFHCDTNRCLQIKYSYSCQQHFFWTSVSFPTIEQYGRWITGCLQDWSVNTCPIISRTDNTNPAKWHVSHFTSSQMK